MKHVDIGDHNLKLPVSITSIYLEHVILGGGVSLDICTMLERLIFEYVDL